MRPTVIAANAVSAHADGTHLRLLYIFASAGKAYSTRITGSRWPFVNRAARGWSGAPIAVEEGRRSGTTTHHHPETDVVVAIIRIVVVAVGSARVV